MTDRPRRLIAGNWKMNGLKAQLAEVESLIASLSADPAAADVLVCPPATLVAQVSQLGDGIIRTGGQDCHVMQSGAHTGDISSGMLADAGATHVIVGHSERRANHSETDMVVQAKARAALEGGLTPIICVGETEAERDTGLAMTVVEQQLNGSVPELGDGDRLAIAYEPVWAIGTGRVPSSEDIVEMHASIRAWLEKRIGAGGATVPILYGGSMKPRNAAEILALDNVDGGLVGGASLKSEDFLGIIRAG